MIDLRKHFGRIHAINLDGRDDRWAAFVARLGVAGFTGVERFRAIDGRKCVPPTWFRAGAGAWGALQSHYRIAQDALQDGLESVLVFEDDVIFRSGAAEEFERIAGYLKGQKWDSFYFGGSHLDTSAGHPEPHARGVVRSFNVNRLHAYALHQRFLPTFTKQALNAPQYVAMSRPAIRPGEREFGPHLDHMLGYLHEKKEHLVLAASPWICGQAAGESNIIDRKVTECYWDA